jgi:phospholipid:diacylglycerol acyltransferase
VAQGVYIVTVLERFFSRKERKRLFLSWAGSASMWMKVCCSLSQYPSLSKVLQGGNAIWGNVTHAPDDTKGSQHSHGELIAFRAQEDAAASFADPYIRNMTADDSSSWILQHTPPTFQQMVHNNYSYGIERDEKRLEENDLDHTKWSNPLEVRYARIVSQHFGAILISIGCHTHLR